MGHVLKAGAAMVSLSAIVAGAIAFSPHAPTLFDKKPAAAPEPIPVGALTRPVADDAAAAPAPAPQGLTRGVTRARPAATDMAEAQRKLADAMARPKAAQRDEDGLSQIALAAGAASPQSAVGRPTGLTSALAFAPTPAGESPESTADLIRRAKVQLRDGAAPSARLLLTRAARGGSADALSLLGQSYDAAALAELGVKGVRADAEEARKYYQRAAAAGSTEAKRRLALLGG